MKKIFVISLVLILNFQFAHSQSSSNPDIVNLPAGSIFVFNSEYLVPANSLSIYLDNLKYIEMVVVPSKSTRKITAGRKFTVTKVKTGRREKAGCSYYYAYVYVSDKNIKYFKINTWFFCSIPSHKVVYKTKDVAKYTKNKVYIRLSGITDF